MADFPIYRLPPSPILTPFSAEAYGAAGLVAAQVVLGGSSSTAWPTANLAYFVPFTLYDWATAYQLLFFVGATSSGNIDVGIYDSNKNRIVSAGSTAMSATVNTVQELNITDTVLPPGQYLMAAAVDNTTGTAFVSSTAGKERGLPAMPLWQETGLTAAALPNPCTPVKATASIPRVPMFGIQFRSVF